jgi:hypothetical protein
MVSLEAWQDMLNACKRIDTPCIFNIVVVASGDSGANGIFLTAAPATGRKVISTGSIDNHLVAGHLLYVKGLPFYSIGKYEYHLIESGSYSNH